jgi:hypothetical protein
MHARAPQNRTTRRSAGQSGEISCQAMVLLSVFPGFLAGRDVAVLPSATLSRAGALEPATKFKEI